MPINENFALQRSLPVAKHKDTGKHLSLTEWSKDPSVALDPRSLDLAQQIDLVCARWQAGEWRSNLIGPDGEITLEQAMKEARAQTDLGIYLVRAGIRAMEMAREDTHLLEEK